MRLLVTGGCGFIGTNFILHLRRAQPDWTIVNLDKLTYAGNRANLVHLEEDEQYKFVHGDIADATLVRRVIEEEAVDAVANFAAETHVDRSITDAGPFLESNVRGVVTLLDECRRAGVKRYVQVSTDEVYGSLGPDDPAFTEESPLRPNSPYAASKAAADHFVRAWTETHGLDAVICRCSNNYGPYQFPEKLIPLMYLKAQADEPLPVYGDGLNVRDWIFVEDHCRGVALALVNGRAGGIYNFGGAAETANLDTVRTLLTLMGKPDSLINFVTDRPGHDRRYAMDFSLARRELGFEPSVDFAQGLKLTLDWYRDHEDWLASVQSGEYKRFMDRWYQERC